MAKGSTTVPATPSKSGGNESSSPDVTAARLAAVSELSTPAPEPVAAGDGHAIVGAERGDEVTFEEPRRRATRRCWTDPDYDDFNDGTEGSKPSVAGAKRSALLNALRPPVNDDTPAAKRVFDRVEAMMKNDDLDDPSRGGFGLAAASGGYENETYPSTMSLQDWSPHEAGAALQQWKKKLRKAFVRSALTKGSNQLERTPPTKRGADHDAFGTADASPYLQDSHMVTPCSTSRMRRMDTEDEGSRGRRGGARASRKGSGRRQANTDASSSDDDDLPPPTYEDEDPQAELTRQMREIAALNDSDPTPRIKWPRTDRWIVSSRARAHAIRWCIPFEVSLRDGAIHWFRQLPKKTKRTWKLLRNAFIRYYCSLFTQTALSRYYSAKRERSEHLCDYLYRLNGKTKCVGDEHLQRGTQNGVETSV
ncbi:hypothetical protein GQ600_5418 [Phytophthora cactorum]|nr:hypothetical protein GQ600_5418 [Phytophthora cactorum]